ncbi:hypothetical protein HYX14_02970 [Candidatus Woesearchaeota archaeon]|nr:hypothetical protein [Candidatus Woesearchaeota archaeon]
MDEIVLMKRTPELEQWCQQLGFQQVLFLDDIQMLSGRKPGEILSQLKGKKYFIYEAADEPTLRFVVEKISVPLVIGMEKINPADSLHYLRGGLDQILCTLARQKEKTIGFSFADILHAQNRPQLLARMMFNIKLCRKYNVKTFFGSFAREKWEMISKKDLEAWKRVLEKGD